jgi:hypothetical protein
MTTPTTSAQHTPEAFANAYVAGLVGTQVIIPCWTVEQAEASLPLAKAAPALLAALEAVMRLVPSDIAETVAGHKARAAIRAATGA